MSKEITDISNNAAREGSLTIFLDFNSMYEMAQMDSTTKKAI